MLIAAFPVTIFCSFVTLVAGAATKFLCSISLKIGMRNAVRCAWILYPDRSAVGIAIIIAAAITIGLYEIVNEETVVKNQ